MTDSNHIGLFLPYPRRRWLRFKIATKGGTLCSFHPTTFASKLSSCCSQSSSGDSLSLLDLIYTFATGCWLLLLDSIWSSSNRASLIQQQSANVSVDGDGWLLLRVASLVFHYDHTFLRTFMHLCSCCFALIEKTSVLVFHFWFWLRKQDLTDLINTE